MRGCSPPQARRTYPDAKEHALYIRKRRRIGAHKCFAPAPDAAPCHKKTAAISPLATASRLAQATQERTHHVRCAESVHGMVRPGVTSGNPPAEDLEPRSRAIRLDAIGQTDRHTGHVVIHLQHQTALGCGQYNVAAGPETIAPNVRDGDALAVNFQPGIDLR